jgi:hypothetical protein
MNKWTADKRWSMLFGSDASLASVTQEATLSASRSRKFIVPMGSNQPPPQCHQRSTCEAGIDLPLHARHEKP